MHNPMIAPKSYPEDPIQLSSRDIEDELSLSTHNPSLIFSQRIESHSFQQPHNQSAHKTISGTSQDPDVFICDISKIMVTHNESVDNSSNDFTRLDSEDWSGTLTANGSSQGTNTILPDGDSSNYHNKRTMHKIPGPVNENHYPYPGYSNLSQSSILNKAIIKSFSSMINTSCNCGELVTFCP